MRKQHFKIDKWEICRSFAWFLYHNIFHMKFQCNHVFMNFTVKFMRKQHFIWFSMKIFRWISVTAHFTCKFPLKFYMWHIRLCKCKFLGVWMWNFLKQVRQNKHKHKLLTLLNLHLEILLEISQIKIMLFDVYCKKYLSVKGYMKGSKSFFFFFFTLFSVLIFDIQWSDSLLIFWIKDSKTRYYMYNYMFNVSYIEIQ